MARVTGFWVMGLVAVALLALVALTAAQAVWGQETAFDLAAAVADAAPGATIYVPAGIHAGPLVIDKPLTLVGEGMPVIQGTGEGNVVEITAPDVTLRGFVVRGTGISLDKEDSAITVGARHVTLEENVVEDALFGIYLHNAPESVLRGNQISGKDLPISRRGDGIKIWYSANSLVEDNVVRDSRDVVIWFAPGTTVRRNTMDHNRYGIHFMSTDDHLVERVRIEEERLHPQPRRARSFACWPESLRLARPSAATASNGLRTSSSTRSRSLSCRSFTNALGRITAYEFPQRRISASTDMIRE